MITLNTVYIQNFEDINIVYLTKAFLPIPYEDAIYNQTWIISYFKATIMQEMELGREGGKEGGMEGGRHGRKETCKEAFSVMNVLYNG